MTVIQNCDVRWIGRSYRYDSAHIPAKAEAAPAPSRAVIRSKDAIIRQCYKHIESKKLQARGRQSKSGKPLPNSTPSGRRSENRDDFRQENISAPRDQMPSLRTAAKPSWRCFSHGCIKLVCLNDVITAEIRMVLTDRNKPFVDTIKQATYVNTLRLANLLYFLSIFTVQKNITIKSLTREIIYGKRKLQ